MAYHHPRSGFTLIELLIALVLFDCALLALAASAALVVRQAGAAQRRTLAEFTARNRIERLRSEGCPEVQVGSASPVPGVHEQWQVTASDSATRLIGDSVSFDLASGRGAVVLHSALQC